ncbi:hypothetical protein TWF281_011391 [Arthrobotrys megalospora]
MTTCEDTSLDAFGPLATKFGEEPIARIVDSQSGETGNLRKCADCNGTHLPRRVVCCVDGTWMGSDGAAGSERGNATNIFRIWASVKDGVVKDVNGISWLQIKKYFQGVGAESGFVSQAYSGITGSGSEDLIAEVYKFCALKCCPSQDEVYFFGYSRGAYVVRAVAALFYHIRTLKRQSDNFDKLYSSSLDIYRKLRNKNNSHKHRVYHHLITNTLAPMPIKFVGVIDTVKFFNDGGLYDITQTPNITHVRHALAMLETRNVFSPEKYIDLETNASGYGHNIPSTSRIRPVQTCIEAWFLGTHGDVGGSLVQDGLSLWPLQFLLSEAETSGLVLGFQPIPNCEILNPLECAMPTKEGSNVDIPQMPQNIPYKNGFTVRMWDLEDIFAKLPEYTPAVNVTKWLLPKGEREITGIDKTSPTGVVSEYFFALEITNRLT